jgi:hypothetical protein
MAREKTGGSPSGITPMPFPGESPTVALAMAAGRKYGLKKKPARKAAAKARPARGRSKAKSR